MENQGVKKQNKFRSLDSSPLVGTLILTAISAGLLFITWVIKRWILPGQPVDLSIIFLVILPFVIYLILSNKISEFKGGGIELKLTKQSQKNVTFIKENVMFTEPEIVKKGNLETLKAEVIPELIEKSASVLTIKLSENGDYSLNGLRMYLRELTKFDFFKYVLFEREGIESFEGLIDAKVLKYQIDDENKGDILVKDLKKGNISGIRGVIKTHIKNYMDNKTALNILEKEGLEDIAVLDEKMHFQGLTNRKLIISRILNELIKAE